MAESFLESLLEEREKEALQRLNKSLARDEILSSMDRGPLMGLASMAVGPGKFKGPVEGIIKLFPKNLDTVEAFPQLQKIVLIKPKILRDKTKIDDIFNNDILNNPNASTRVELTLSKNRDAYNLFDDFVKSLGDPKGMLGGGKVDMMPLKYEI